jgi:hypothetical protein
MRRSRHHVQIFIPLFFSALLALPLTVQADGVSPTDMPEPTDTPELTNTPIPTNTPEPTEAPTSAPQGEGDNELTEILVTPTPTLAPVFLSGFRDNFLLNLCLVGVIVISILATIGIVGYQGYIRSRGET